MKANCFVALWQIKVAAALTNDDSTEYQATDSVSATGISVYPALGSTHNA